MNMKGTFRARDLVRKIAKRFVVYILWNELTNTEITYQIVVEGIVILTIAAVIVLVGAL